MRKKNDSQKGKNSIENSYPLYQIYTLNNFRLET